MEPIAIQGRPFVRTFPIAGSVARLRAVAAAHPKLIHHYTFEGISAQEKRQDSKGRLHLAQVVMQAGDGGGKFDYQAAGLDSTTNAVRPYRSLRDGNHQGVSLQSEQVFCPPDALTVELLLNFGGFLDDGEGQISAALATRDSQDNCGFFVVVVGRGRLVHLMQADAPSWVEAEMELIPGDWYYLASTFRVQSDGTVINSYLANLSRQERTLRWVVRNEVAPGRPATSRLGVGKGFAANLAHAYPWSGALDEVAIYGAVLDRKTLQEHLQALAGNLPGQQQPEGLPFAGAGTTTFRLPELDKVKPIGIAGRTGKTEAER